MWVTVRIVRYTLQGSILPYRPVLPPVLQISMSCMIAGLMPSHDNDVHVRPLLERAVQAMQGSPDGPTITPRVRDMTRQNVLAEVIIGFIFRALIIVFP